VDDPSFMSRVITGDESWVYGYDPETKQQSSQWKSPGSPRPKKARQSRSTTKSMLVFFDIRGIVHHEFVPEGQTVNTEFCCSVLRRLREDIRQKQPELWCAGNWLLRDDNPPSHRALVTREVPVGIAECSWYASRTGLPARVPAVAMALGSMCRCTRGLF